MNDGSRPVILAPVFERLLRTGPLIVAWYTTVCSAFVVELHAVCLC